MRYDYGCLLKEKECEEEGARESVRKQDEQTYIDSVMPDDFVTNSDFSDDEKALAEADLLQ